jgi:hypothetical protein
VYIICDGIIVILLASKVGVRKKGVITVFRSAAFHASSGAMSSLQYEWHHDFDNKFRAITSTSSHSSPLSRAGCPMAMFHTQTIVTRQDVACQSSDHRGSTHPSADTARPPADASLMKLKYVVMIKYRGNRVIGE